MSILDPQLWHAYAGGMVHMPPVNSTVFYFPQGHAEHATAAVDFYNSPEIAPFVLCRVSQVLFLADPETDEVYAKTRLVPLFGLDLDIGNEFLSASVDEEKLASFPKTLTQSDANNGGGFSVPRYCAESIFPQLDRTADPPVQNIYARDVHGVLWDFRHIYRGTPRRHLLTTGWSQFVNNKKLVAGDSIIFVRDKDGELCVGIRRAKRGFGAMPESPTSWTNNALSMILGEGGESRLMRSSGMLGKSNALESFGRGRVSPESVIEAVNLASRGQPFEVVYYPGGSTPEFCIKASTVRASMAVQWCSGMRFKMAFETEDSSRISWFVGTVSSLQVAEPIRWPSSPWRLLRVAWDEPDLLQNVTRVSPWQVELVSSIPIINMPHLLPPSKKFQHPQHHTSFPALDRHLLVPILSGNLLGVPTSTSCLLPDNFAPARIQGARHSHPLSIFADLNFTTKFPSGSFGPFPSYDPPRIQGPVPAEKFQDSDSLSCSLAIGPSQNNSAKPACEKKRKFLLFGQTIHTEQPIISQNTLNFALDAGHCKVFLESEEVGRILDLNVLGSYEELCDTLMTMFGIERLDIRNHVLYEDARGIVGKVGNEPFSDFVKTAKRLTILANKTMRRSIPHGSGIVESSAKNGPLSTYA